MIALVILFWGIIVPLGYLVLVLHFHRAAMKAASQDLNSDPTPWEQAISKNRQAGMGSLLNNSLTFTIFIGTQTAGPPGRLGLWDWLEALRPDVRETMLFVSFPFAICAISSLASEYRINAALVRHGNSNMAPKPLKPRIALVALMTLLLSASVWFLFQGGLYGLLVVGIAALTLVQSLSTTWPTKPRWLVNHSSTDRMLPEETPLAAELQAIRRILGYDPVPFRVRRAITPLGEWLSLTATATLARHDLCSVLDFRVSEPHLSQVALAAYEPAEITAAIAFAHADADWTRGSIPFVTSANATDSRLQMFRTTCARAYRAWRDAAPNEPRSRARFAALLKRTGAVHRNFSNVAGALKTGQIAELIAEFVAEDNA